MQNNRKIIVLPLLDIKTYVYKNINMNVINNSCALATSKISSK